MFKFKAWPLPGAWRWRAFDAACAVLSAVMALYYVRLTAQPLPSARLFMGIGPAIWAWSWGITAGLCAISVVTNGTGVMVSTIQRVVRAELTGRRGRAVVAPPIGLSSTKRKIG